MGFQLHFFFGVKKVFFFQFPKDPSLGLELGFWWPGDDDLPLTSGPSAGAILMEAPTNLASCLMCAPFFPMMAPTAWVGMKRFTISCSGYWEGETRRKTSFQPGFLLQALNGYQAPYHEPHGGKAPPPKEMAKMVHGILLRPAALQV